MTTATNAIYNGALITVGEALDIRQASGKSVTKFLCTECSHPVRVHRDGGHASAHFEHLKRNPECKLSHQFGSKRADAKAQTWSIDSTKAIEGYEIDRKTLALARNAGLAEKCKKRDNYTCAACYFRLKVQGQYIAEAHHLIPVASGIREVTLSELVTLCPTCHRIAHTRETPFSVEELRALLKKANA